MKGGGTIDGGLWTARVKTLRTLDHIRCLNWTNDEMELWMGGETLVVIWAEPTGLRDGFWTISVYSLDCPTEQRVICIRADDKVVLVARDLPMDGQTKIPKQQRSKKPKKGEQLKLF